MPRYLVKRAFGSALTLLALVIGLFFALHALGDPVALALPDEYTPEQYSALQSRLGYDRPLVVQFTDHIASVLRADFGESVRTGREAIDIVMAALPRTLFLGMLAFLISLIGIPLGVLAATRPRSVMDTVINSASFALLSAPGFWVALVGIYVFAVKLGLLPTSGFNGYTDIRYMVLPACVLATNSLARFIQISRTAVMEELAKPYVQTARAKGLSGETVLWIHVLKNAGIPIVTVGGDEIASIVNGSVIMETIFGWPGIGYLLVTAIQQRDLPLVTATVIVVATLVMLINFVVDMLYSWLDPRIRYE